MLLTALETNEILKVSTVSISLKQKKARIVLAALLSYC